MMSSDGTPSNFYMPSLDTFEIEATKITDDLLSDF